MERCVYFDGAGKQAVGANSSNLALNRSALPRNLQNGPMTFRRPELLSPGRRCFRPWSDPRLAESAGRHAGLKVQSVGTHQE